MVKTMYNSPIDLTINTIYNELAKKSDEQIYQAVIGCGVNVDKAELLKALEYDRNQYEIGFIDGVKKFAEMLKERKYQSSEWSHGGHPYVIEIDDIDDVLEEMGVE